MVEGGSLSEEQVQAQNAQIEAKNEESKQRNDEVLKLQAKVSWSVPALKHAKPATVEGEWMYPENPSDFGFWKENCYIKVLNYKEEPVQVPADDQKPLAARTLSFKDADKAKMMQSIDQS